MRRKWKMAAIVAAVAALGLTAVAGASAATTTTSRTAGDGCAELTGNPQALAEMQTLRTEKRNAWQAWFEKYGSDRRSDEAQTALEKLREQYRAQMTALHEKYGIDTSECAPGSERRGGQGGGMMRGAGGGMGGGMGGGACAAPAGA